MNKWWDGVPGEHYWLEITERVDLGADLNAPLHDEKGNQNANYALVGEANDGDIVFRLDKRLGAIVAHSVIRGEAWNDQVVWGARGASARGHDVKPYVRPGLRRALQHFSLLTAPVSLEQVRTLESQILSIRDKLREIHGDPVYYPFAPYKGQGLRPFQGYMVKFPRDLVSLFGLPTPAPLRETNDGRFAAVTVTTGAPYRRADEEIAVSPNDPMARDPALMERALRSHRVTQNALADALLQMGIVPLSPGNQDVDWDIAWRHEGTLYVAEIKSITASNEERQLRLGLGQVLRYRQHCSDPCRVAVLVVERRPSDDSWLALCEQLGVALVWPDSWRRLFAEK